MSESPKLGTGGASLIAETQLNEISLSQSPINILQDLLCVAKNIEAILNQKGAGDSSTDAGVRRPTENTMLDAEGSRLREGYAKPADFVNDRIWFDDERKKCFSERCTKHRSECYNMWTELRRLLAHHDNVGGNEEHVKFAQLLVSKDKLFAPIDSIDEILNDTADMTREPADKVWRSVEELYGLVNFFWWSMHQEGEHCARSVGIWRNILYNASYRMAGNCVRVARMFDEDIFSNLESAMRDVAGELSKYEQKSAIRWISEQKFEDFEEQCKKYIYTVFKQFCPTKFSPTNYFSSKDAIATAWPDQDTIARFERRCAEHRIACNTFQEELEHLITHFGIVGGDKGVIIASRLLQEKVIHPVHCLEEVLRPETRLRGTDEIINAIGELFFAVGRFQRSLYHQKHAFYFREVEQWATCVWNGLHGCTAIDELDKCLHYVCDDLFPRLEQVMLGVSDVHRRIRAEGMRPAMIAKGNVAEELKMFGERSLPNFLADEKERDTARYVNITTIATFFSSVTATTLQFSFMQSETVLGGLLNLFWFLSLVFSVSSAVSSLLGMTWRRSSIYHSPHIPPILVRMWLDKAPMVFLIIAAVFFVIGLNLFAHQSLQPRYVSLSTNLLTGLHIICILSVTAWFIYGLKYESYWSQCIRATAAWVWKYTKWIWTILKWSAIIVHFIYRRFMSRVRKTYESTAASVMGWVVPLYEKFIQDQHRRRIGFWLKLDDYNVAEINDNLVYGCRDWPEPNLLFQLIRRVNECRVTSRNALISFGRSVRRTVLQDTLEGYVEAELESREWGQGTEAGPSHSTELTLARRARAAINLYERSLRSVFYDAHLVKSILEELRNKLYNDGVYDDTHIRRYLWGYSKLFKEYRKNVRPLLVSLNEQNAKERERERLSQEDRTWKHDIEPDLTLQGRPSNQNVVIADPESTDPQARATDAAQRDIRIEHQMQSTELPCPSDDSCHPILEPDPSESKNPAPSSQLQSVVAEITDVPNETIVPSSTEVEGADEELGKSKEDGEKE